MKQFKETISNLTIFQKNFHPWITNFYWFVQEEFAVQFQNTASENEYAWVESEWYQKLKAVVVVNKRKLHLSMQRMQLLARSARTFILNRHYGVFEELLFKHSLTFFLTQQLRKTILMLKYMARVTFTKNIFLENFNRICIATKWKIFLLKNIKFYRFCC